MQQADEPLHAARQLRRAQSPAFAEEQVVAILEAHASVLAENIQLVELLLQVHQADLPGPLLLFDHVLQGVGGAAVSATGVEEEEIDLLHRTGTRRRSSSKKLSRKIICVGGFWSSAVSGCITTANRLPSGAMSKLGNGP